MQVFDFRNDLHWQRCPKNRDTSVVFAVFCWRCPCCRDTSDGSVSLSVGSVSSRVSGSPDWGRQHQTLSRSLETSLYDKPHTRASWCVSALKRNRSWRSISTCSFMESISNDFLSNSVLHNSLTAGKMIWSRKDGRLLSVDSSLIFALEEFR